MGENRLLFLGSLWATTNCGCLLTSLSLHAHFLQYVAAMVSPLVSLTFSSWSFFTSQTNFSTSMGHSTYYQNIPVITRCEIVVLFFLPLPLSGKDLSLRSEDDLSCIFGKRQKSMKTQVNKRLHLSLVTKPHLNVFLLMRLPCAHQKHRVFCLWNDCCCHVKAAGEGLCPEPLGNEWI